MRGQGREFAADFGLAQRQGPPGCLVGEHGRRHQRPGRRLAARHGPARGVHQVRVQLRRQPQVPQRDAGEGIQRQVVLVVVRGVREKHPGGRAVIGGELLQDGLQVGQHLLAFVGRARAIGVGVGDLRDARQHAAQRGLGAPMLCPDPQRAEVGIAEEGELPRRQAQDACRRQCFVMTNQTHRLDLAGQQLRLLAIEHERPLVGIAIGQEDHAHRQVHLQRLLDDAPARDGFVVRVRGQDQNAVSRIQGQFRRVELRGGCSTLKRCTWQVALCCQREPRQQREGSRQPQRPFSSARQLFQGHHVLSARP